jgi:hypothetical protein
MKGPLGLATLALFVLFSAPAAALAEGHGFGYAFTSPMSLAGIGARAFGWNTGGGGEWWTGSGTSVGGEIGLVNLFQSERHTACCSSYSPSYDAMLFSINGAQHVGRTGNWSPFATGGFSLIPGEAAFFNVGGGVDHSTSRHLGLRLEVREHFGMGSMLAFRIGVVFR